MKKYFDSDDLINPGLGLQISWLTFFSKYQHNSNANSSSSLFLSTGYKENQQFKFPVIHPIAGKQTFNKAIVLLHGLNERKWYKYLPWAKFLVDKLQRPVILFPIAYHMNRSPAIWSDPRALLPELNNRKLSFQNLILSSFANVALSERLTQTPACFFNSGYQSALDLIQFASQVKKNGNAFLSKGAQLDFFGYSIGGFLSQILKLANPNNLFGKTKLFLFCSGCTFDNMHGISKYIMDSKANEKLTSFYLHDIEEKSSITNYIRRIIRKTAIGNAFNLMLSQEKFSNFFSLEKREEYNKNTFTIAMKNDAVMPSEAIRLTTSDSCLQVIDPSYEYFHENPFPERNEEEINATFKDVFTKAVDFLR